MSFSDWVGESIERVREYGTRGAVVSAQEFWVGVLRRIGQQWNYGTTCFEHDWDVFVILDACRHDVMQEVADEYEFLPAEIPSAFSCASASPEYVEKAFGESHRDERERTALVSGNGFTKTLLSGSEFGHTQNLIKKGWSNELGTVPPRTVTDSAVKLWRDRPRDIDRMVVWYMQPHAPYRSVEDVERYTRDEVGTLENVEREQVWDRLRYGDMSEDEAWEAYRDNLRWVLDDVELLLENVDAERVILTSDHGECFGEWGCYSHPPHVPLPSLKRVPWVETTGIDEATHEPAFEASESEVDGDIEERLTALGYR